MPYVSCVRALRAGLLGAAALLLAACSSRDPALTKPAELVEIKSPRPARIVWRTDVGAARGLALQPAVLDNAIYAAAANGEVTRIAPDTGKEVWRVALDVSISAGVGSDGLRLAVASPRGDVVALGPDGKELWRTRVASDVTAPPLVGHGLVIVRSTDHRIAAFEADSGKRRWLYQRQQPPLTLRAPTEMAFAGDSVLIGFPGGKLVALALANGAARWEVNVSEPKGTTEVERLADVVGPPAIDGREVCAASFQGRLTCADAANGSLRWSRDLSAGAGPAIGGARVYAVDARSHLYAYGRDGGANAWRNDQLRNRQLTTPLALAQAIVVGDLKGYVHFLAPDDGALLARVEVGDGAIVARPQRWADGIVVQTVGGTVALLSFGR
ncbi:MAG TPA: outer membrane protein assembly factor BamB [Burkholderiaceae bacterium]|jgi:outer membrane protein assembly factor BamB|nr:outer membrane protein assembly factor BamB [Burkholderiaceae bacterium]